MRAILQRVSTASVKVNAEVISSIGRGWLVLLGVGQKDAIADADYLVDRILGLRGFADPEGKMNLSIRDIGGELLIVSQFTLYADCTRGRRPGFSDAASPDRAESLYLHTTAKLKESGLNVQTGRFQAHMDVQLVNDGPVTFTLESPTAS